MTQSNPNQFHHSIIPLFHYSTSAQYSHDLHNRIPVAGGGCSAEPFLQLAQSANSPHLSPVETESESASELD
jgi:hypothetical protein